MSELTGNLRPYRPAVFAELDRPGIRYFAYYSGRASGKSHAIAQTVVRRGVDMPLRALFLRETLKSLRDSSKQLLEDWIQVLGLSNEYEVLRDEIRGPRGTSFRFGGLAKNSASQVRSAAGIKLAVVEEAHEISEESLRVLRPTIRDPGAQLIFPWNPQLPTDAVDHFFRGSDHPPPSSVIRQVSWRDNPFLDSAMIAEMEYDRRRDPAMYEHVWEGAYLQITDAQVFGRTWRFEDMNDEVADMGKHAIPRLGVDWGFSKDPLAAVEAYLLPNDIIYVKREKFQVKLPVQQTATWLKDFDKIEAKYPVICDNARPELIDLCKREGIRAKPAVKGANSLIDGVDFLRSKEIILHPDCKRLSNELTHYSYKIDPHTEQPLPEIAPRQSDHAIDALRYAMEPVRRMKGRRRISTTGPRIIRPN